MNRTTGEGANRADEPSAGPQPSGVDEPSAEEAANAGSAANPDVEGSAAECDAASEDEAADAAGSGVADGVPVGGRHVWIPPGGDPRELSSGQLPGRPTAEATARGCSGCGGARSVETVVREHVPCGQVGLDGFVATDGEHAFACPKCGARSGPDPAEADEFSVVGTVHTCLGCGRVLDRPLDGDSDEDR